MRWLALGVVLAAACRPAASRPPEPVTVEDVIAGLEVVEWTPRPEPEPEPAPTFELEPVEDAPTPMYLVSESARSPRDQALTVPCQQASGCAPPRSEPELRLLVQVSDPKGETLQRMLDRHWGIERCMTDELRRDRCRRSGAALIYRVGAQHKAKLMGREGLSDTASKCVDRHIRGMRLETWAPMQPVDVHILMVIQPVDDPSCPAAG